jgi:hypothetical protein
VQPKVTAVIGSRILAGPGWTLHADRPVEPARPYQLPGSEQGWSAVVGVRRQLKLLVTGSSVSPHPAAGRDVAAEAWAGDPGQDTDGVAVVRLTGDPAGRIALARIPLCGCGIRGCGNASLQLSKLLTPGELPALIALLRELPWSSKPARSEQVLRGDGLAALPELGLPEGRVTRRKIVYRGSRMADGVRVPYQRVIEDWSETD